jgi:hypothetical protein
MIGTTLIATMYAFLEAHREDIASKVIASACYDILKKSLNFGTLKSKLQGFFKKDQDSEKFIETLCEQKMTSDGSADEAVKKAYESIAEQPFDEKVLTLINDWLSENKEAIQNLTVINNTNNSGGFNIGSQNAGSNIYNIQGDFKPGNK